MLLESFHGVSVSPDASLKREESGWTGKVTASPTSNKTKGKTMSYQSKSPSALDFTTVLQGGQGNQAAKCKPPEPSFLKKALVQPSLNKNICADLPHKPTQLWRSPLTTAERTLAQQHRHVL